MARLTRLVLETFSSRLQVSKPSYNDECCIQPFFQNMELSNRSGAPRILGLKIVFCAQACNIFSRAIA